MAAAITVEFLTNVCSEVFTELGSGHSEKVYQKGIISVLNSMKVFHRSEVNTPIYLRGDVVGVGRADIVVGNLAVELKAVSNMVPRASGQLAKYVKSLNNDKINEFNKKNVVSAYFSQPQQRSNGGDSCTVIDVEYQYEKDLMMKSLFSGVLVNFNQRTNEVEVATVVYPEAAADNEAVEAAAVVEDIKPTNLMINVAIPAIPISASNSRSFLAPPVTTTTTTMASRCPIAKFLAEFVDHPRCITKSASGWYDLFVTTEVGKYSGITGGIFGRVMSNHAADESSGITKTRLSCSGSKYTIDPVKLKEYLLGNNNQNGNSNKRQRSEMDTDSAVDSFVKMCLQFSDEHSSGASLLDLAEGFESFTGNGVGSIADFRRSISRHLSTQITSDRELLFPRYPGKTGITLSI